MYLTLVSILLHNFSQLVAYLELNSSKNMINSTSKK